RGQEDEAGDQHRLDLSAEGRARRCARLGRSGACHRPLKPRQGRPRSLAARPAQAKPARRLFAKQETKMNQHTTSYPVASTPEELVPSRYALKIGDIDVLVVSDGVLPLPTQMLGHNATPADRAAWLHEMFLPTDAFDWALNAVMVRSGGKTILIDA